MSYYAIRFNDELEHHGILGMKWGKRNGPPYPLDDKAHSSSENKAGWKQSLEKSQNGDKPEHKGLSNKQKKIIKTTAIVAGSTVAAGLAIYSGYKLYKIGSLNKLAVNGKLITNNLLRKNSNIKITQIAGTDMQFKKSDKIPSIMEAYKGINPSSNTGPDSDINFVMLAKDGKPLHRVNCQACTFTQEMIQRGYKGIAQLIDTRGLSEESVFSKLYKNPNVEIKDVPSWSSLSKIIVGKEGERGNLTVPLMTGSHSLRYEIFHGKLVITDPQIGFAFDGDNAKIWEKLYRVSGDVIRTCRTDNLELNDEAFIRRFFAEITQK